MNKSIKYVWLQVYRPNLLLSPISVHSQGLGPKLHSCQPPNHAAPQSGRAHAQDRKQALPPYAPSFKAWIAWSRPPSTVCTASWDVSEAGNVENRSWSDSNSETLYFVNSSPIVRHKWLFDIFVNIFHILAFDQCLFLLWLMRLMLQVYLWPTLVIFCRLQFNIQIWVEVIFYMITDWSILHYSFFE